MKKDKCCTSNKKHFKKDDKNDSTDQIAFEVFQSETV